MDDVAILISDLDPRDPSTAELTAMIHRGIEVAIPEMDGFPPLTDLRRLVVVLRAHKEQAGPVDVGCVEVATDTSFFAQAGAVAPDIGLRAGAVRVLTVVDGRLIRAVLHCPPMLADAVRDCAASVTEAPHKHVVVHGCLCSPKRQRCTEPSSST